MASIQERRMKAAGKRIKKGKKPFTDARPAPKKKRTPSKGLPKRGKIPLPGTAAHDKIVRQQMERADGIIRNTVDWGAITDTIGKSMPRMKKKKSDGGDYGGGYI